MFFVGLRNILNNKQATSSYVVLIRAVKSGYELRTALMQLR